MFLVLARRCTRGQIPATFKQRVASFTTGNSSANNDSAPSQTKTNPSVKPPNFPQQRGNNKDNSQNLNRHAGKKSQSQNQNQHGQKKRPQVNLIQQLQREVTESAAEHQKTEQGEDQLNHNQNQNQSSTNGNETDLIQQNQQQVTENVAEHQKIEQLQERKENTIRKQQLPRGGEKENEVDERDSEESAKELVERARNVTIKKVDRPEVTRPTLRTNHEEKYARRQEQLSLEEDYRIGDDPRLGEILKRKFEAGEEPEFDPELHLKSVYDNTIKQTSSLEQGNEYDVDELSKLLLDGEIPFALEPTETESTTEEEEILLEEDIEDPREKTIYSTPPRDHRIGYLKNFLHEEVLRNAVDSFTVRTAETNREKPRTNKKENPVDHLSPFVPGELLKSINARKMYSDLVVGVKDDKNSHLQKAIAKLASEQEQMEKIASAVVKGPYQLPVIPKRFATERKRFPNVFDKRRPPKSPYSPDEKFAIGSIGYDSDPDVVEEEVVVVKNQSDSDESSEDDVTIQRSVQ